MPPLKIIPKGGVLDCAHLVPDTLGDQATCLGQPRVRRSIKLMRKMSILQALMQITDYAPVDPSQ